MELNDKRVLLNPASPARGQIVHTVAEPPLTVMAPRAEDSIPTRHSLLIRLKQLDNEPSWREFFERYWELIYNLARKAGLNDAEAQDVVQETIIGVAGKIGEFKVDPRLGSFKSWLLGQARWRIADQFRARKKAAAFTSSGPSDDSGGRRGVVQLLDGGTGTSPLHQLPDLAVDPLERIWEEEWEQHFLRMSLERVRAQVSVKQYQMFDLHALQGVSVRETARALGTTMAAVYMAKSRVGRLLRREVARLRAASG